MKKAIWIPFLAVFAVLGCMTAPIPEPTMASGKSDAAAKEFSPPAGKANLYVEKSGGFLAGNEPFMISVDGKDLGSIKTGTFILVAASPGKHSLKARSKSGEGSLTVSSEAGKNYFYQVESSGSGAQAKVEISIVLFEKMGKLSIGQSKRAKAEGD